MACRDNHTRLSTIEDYTTLKQLIERTRLSHGLSTIEDYTTLKPSCHLISRIKV